MDYGSTASQHRSACSCASPDSHHEQDAYLFVLLWGEEKSLLLTPLDHLVRILDSNQGSELFFSLTETWLFSLCFHIERILWDYLASTVLLWVELLHTHPWPSAQSNSVSFHFPVEFTAYISSHRWPLEWLLKTSGYISPLRYYYLLIVLGLCCTWLAIQIKLAMTWWSSRVTANKQPLQQWVYSECMGKSDCYTNMETFVLLAPSIYRHEGVAGWNSVLQGLWVFVLISNLCKDRCQLDFCLVISKVKLEQLFLPLL